MAAPFGTIYDFANSTTLNTNAGVLQRSVAAGIIVTNPVIPLFFDMIGNERIRSAKHEWLLRTMRAPSGTAIGTGSGPTSGTEAYGLVTEGSEYAYTDENVPVPTVNYTSILRESAEVTEDAAASSMYGIGSLMKDQIKVAQENIRGHAEDAVLNATQNIGPEGTAREMDGAFAIAGVDTDASAVALTQAVMETHLQDMFEAHAEPEDVLLTPQNQNAVNLFTDGSQKYIDAATNTMHFWTSIYDSAYGRLRMHLTRTKYLANTQMLVFQAKTLRKGWHRMPKLEFPAKTGSTFRAIVEMAFTLVYGDPNHLGKITNLPV